MSGRSVASLVRALDQRQPGAFKLVALTGGVAAGKSSFARALRRALILQRRGAVELVSTDGFLREEPDLERAGILDRKGFPESYDHDVFARFFATLAHGAPELEVPVYCHRKRGVIAQRRFARPEWLIVEGVYALQPALAAGLPCTTIFLDTDLPLMLERYLQRFLRLHGARFATRADAVQYAEQIYERVNLANYLQHIAPLRERADLVVRETPGYGFCARPRELTPAPRLERGALLAI